MPRSEAIIAASFGLIRGSAFASVLDKLGVARKYRLFSLFQSNPGIDAMNLVVIAVSASRRDVRSCFMGLQCIGPSPGLPMFPNIRQVSFLKALICDRGMLQGWEVPQLQRENKANYLKSAT